MINLKTATLVDTRPELISLSSIVSLLDLSSSIEHILAHTGQNYDCELNEIFIEYVNMENVKFELEKYHRYTC